MGVSVPAFIICRDRLTDLKALVEWLERAGHDRITFLDNDSTWPPLLEYLEATPHSVVRFGVNMGPHVMWDWDVPDEYFIYTDPDVVPHEDCPLDAVDHLRFLLDRHDVAKAGLGLYINDVAPTPQLGWEWQLHSDSRWLGDCFDSPVDTTFALYRPSSPRSLIAVRSGPPYEVRHMPWYRRNNLTEEDVHYFSRASGASTWKAICGR